MVLAGSWVNAQTFELTKDSALIGEKSAAKLDSRCFYGYIKPLLVEAGGNECRQWWYNYQVDMEWVKGQNEDEGDTLWIESRNSGKVYSDFWRRLIWTLPMEKKKLPAFFIKAPQWKRRYWRHQGT